MEGRSRTAELVPLARQCPGPPGAVIRSVSRGRAQSAPRPAPAAGVGKLPQDVLSCSMPPGPGFPHPTQTVCARNPGLSLSPGWSTTSAPRDVLPLPASPSHPWHNFACHSPGCLQSKLHFCSLPNGCTWDLQDLACLLLFLQPRAPACSSCCFLPSHRGPLEPAGCLSHPPFSQCCVTTPKMTREE